MTKPYGLYKRNTGKHLVYYVRFRDPETNKRLPGITTGCLKKAEAESFAVNYLKNGKVATRSKVSFRNFTLGFFDFDTSTYIKKQLASGARFSRPYAESCAGNLKNHLVPRFGDMLVSSIRVIDIEEFIEDLIKKGLGLTTVKNITTVLSLILAEAFRTDFISTNPMQKVKKHVPRYSERGTLSWDIISLLFSGSSLSNIWDGDDTHYLINFTALVTGMRQGEILALRWCDIHDKYIDLNHKWYRKYGLSSPKYESQRFIPLPGFLKKLYDIRQRDIKVYDDSQDFIFRSIKGNKPIDHKLVNDRFYSALNKVGIDEPERLNRNITFHSWRHTFTSLFRSKISDADLELIVGHKSTEMLDHYTHANIDKMQTIIPIQENVFSSLFVA